MSQNKINTTSLTQFINQVRAAELAHQREVKIDLTSAKTLSHTLALVMTRLAGNYEDLLVTVQKPEEEVVSVSMDGGVWDNK